MVEVEKKPYDGDRMLAELDASINAFKDKMNTVNQTFLVKMAINTGHSIDVMKNALDRVEARIEACAEENVRNGTTDKPVTPLAAAMMGGNNSRKAAASVSKVRKSVSPKRNANTRPGWR